MGYANTEAIEKVSVEMNLEKEVMIEMLKKRLMEIKEQKNNKKNCNYNKINIENKKLQETKLHLTK